MEPEFLLPCSQELVTEPVKDLATGPILNRAKANRWSCTVPNKTWAVDLSGC